MPHRDTKIVSKESGAPQTARAHEASVGDSVRCSMHRRKTTVKYVVAGLVYLACGCFMNGAGDSDEEPGTAGQGCLFDPSEFDGSQPVRRRAY